MNVGMNKEELEECIGKDVVVDTDSAFIYIGKLSQIGATFITLEDVDVHHMEPGGATKEMYALTAKKHGINMNRLSTKIRVDIITSISLLEDVIEY